MNREIQEVEYQYSELANDYFKMAKFSYERCSRFLIIMAAMLLSSVIIAVVQYYTIGDLLSDNPLILDLEFIFTAIWIVSLAATIIFRLKFLKHSAKYRLFRILTLLQIYKKDETELLTDKNVQTAVFHSIMEDTRFKPKHIFQALNIIYDGKMNEEWCLEEVGKQK